MADGNVVGDRQEYTFQAEIKQLLHLLSHSLYQSREIAVRELISNASDALDKMRYVSLTDESQREAGALEIVIEGNEGDKQLVIRDNGHRDDPRRAGGEPRHDRAERVGRVPQGDGGEAATSKPDVSLIGQFGVGFYSAFMIADRVRVRTRSYQEESGWEWESDGSGSFTVTPAEGPLPRGTEVILHLKDDAKDFAAGVADPGDRPAVLELRPVPDPAGAAGEVLNDQKPIWVEPKSQVTDGAVHPVLPAPDPPPRREAAVAPPPGGRLADPVPRDPLLPADEPRAARLHPARPRAEPLRQAGAGAVASAATWCPNTCGSSTAWSIRRTCR